MYSTTARNCFVNRHVDELAQVYEINEIHNVPTDVMKMKLSPMTQVLVFKAKDWFSSQGLVFKVRKRIH